MGPDQARGFESQMKIQKGVGILALEWHFGAVNVSTSPGVVRFQPRIKVFCEPGVISFPVGLGLEDIDVIEHGCVRLRLAASAFFVACRDVASEALIRGHCLPSLIASARHPSLLRKLRSEGWRRRESNPRPETFRQNIYIHSLCFKIRPSELPQAGFPRD